MRRIEEFGLASLNQQLLDMAENGVVDGGNGQKTGVTVKVTAPCKPSASPSDWTFYLHNIKVRWIHLNGFDRIVGRYVCGSLGMGLLFGFGF